MPGTWPDAPAPSRIDNFRSVESTFYNRTVNGQSQARRIGGQHFAFTLGYDSLSRENKQKLNAFAMKQNGRYGTFQVVLPDRAVPLGVATGTPLVNSPVAAGQSVVNIDGFTPATPGIMKADDLLKFSGHSKVYSIIDDVDSGAEDGILLEDSSGVILLETGDVLLLETTGQAAITIKPELVESVADNEAVTVQSVPFTMGLASPVQTYSVRSPTEYDMEFDMEEEY